MKHYSALAQLRELMRDVPYQSLIKTWLAEHVNRHGS
ncbi:MAG: BrnA antitoxin family protein [Nitrococcus sp.]|nr:BrnA antitoxin family protein [Nitrococcus sp.]